MSGFLGSLWAIILGTLFRFRVLPFLHADTILSGGKQVPTKQFAHFGSNFFYCGAVVFFVFSLVGVLTLNEARRRYIAQLPRWQQWAIWPFHGVPQSVATQQSPPIA